MEPLRKITSVVIPLIVDNIDTDQILPARFLKITNKSGLGEKLFHDWRYNPDGSPKTDFILNQPDYRNAQIILAGDNFGCGSSREHAPWALTAFGIRAVISTSIADIFRNNALKNGLIPVVVTVDEHRRLREEVEKNVLLEITIDVEKQEVILPVGSPIKFEIDSFSKYCLINGLDELQYLLKFTKEIEQYEKEHSF